MEAHKNVRVGREDLCGVRQRTLHKLARVRWRTLLVDLCSIRNEED